MTILFLRLEKRQKASGKVMKTFFFGEHLRVVFLVLGLGFEHSYPWLRIFLCVFLALALSLVFSTPPLHVLLRFVNYLRRVFWP